MEELEDRMFSLSELIRKEAPDNAARLVLGLQRSREELIVDEMAEISKLIEKNELKDVEERQRRVVFRLKELRELLLSTELDLILKLKRLRLMNKALKDLDQLRKEQKDTENATDGEHADQRRKEARQTAELLEQQAKEAGADAAARELARSRDLLSGKPVPKQPGVNGEKPKGPTKPSESLDKAHDELRRARDELLRELRAYIRRALIDALLQMIEVQEKSNESVDRFLARKAAGKGRPISRRDFTRFAERVEEVVSRLRDGQQLIEETEFSPAMGPAFQFYREYADELLTVYRAGRLDDGLRGVGSRLVEDLRKNVDLLSEETKWMKKVREGDERGRRQVVLLTELNTLRIVQGRLRSDIQRLLAAGAKDAYRRALGRNGRWEKIIQDVTARLQARGDSDLLNGPADDEADF
ncbi:MAG: hypothetical protein CMJ83_17700 [Planctomycetes bacterium]|nr:hypothetical protein [Planctomycetota bacterium]